MSVIHKSEAGWICNFAWVIRVYGSGYDDCTRHLVLLASSCRHPRSESQSMAELEHLGHFAQRSDRGLDCGSWAEACYSFELDDVDLKRQERWSLPELLSRH